MTDELGRESRGGTILGDELGKRDEPVEIVDYDPRWPTLFGQMRDRLQVALGETARRIDHVGSTAVPDLPAKPVVDIQVSVPDVEREEDYRAAIEARGFMLRYREPGHRYFKPPPSLPRVHQVHVCTAGSQWERDHLLFRDYLRAHPARAAEYGELKRRLARANRLDRIAYTDAKGPWILAALSEAEEWARATDWKP
jgi:GrpB-like predicted nucleotidyltransferase (UPF0157 family)